MGEFKISVGISIPSWSPVSANVFPSLARAVAQLGEEARDRWVAYARGAQLPSGLVIRERSGQYARSIGLRQVGDFTVEVYSDLPYASAIEEGSPRRDLKKILNSSLKVRISAKGKRYLIIPFRWFAPNSVAGHNMPQAVYDWWQGKRARSAITGWYRRQSGTGAFGIHNHRPIVVPGWRHRYGDRLTGDVLAELGIEGLTAKRLAGMLNYRKPGARGGSSHSKYITFRTMVEGSPGWIVPAQPGRFPAKTVAEQIQPLAEDALRHAAEADIRRILGAR